ncbi:PrsW family intramembrane metalloprotease [Halopenitus salinus]|uniref:PrsW family intramembrane metalloprotease n=1 Tax=Halopenitus salinus TaxID=1198295 RepID=A0ABD5V3Q5_9EURY
MIPRRRLRRIARIARWETTRTAGGIDRRTAAIGIVVLVVAGGVGAATLSAGVGGVALDSDVYRVGVAPDSPYHDAVEADPALDPRPPDAGTLGEELDVIVVDTEDGVRLHASRTRKGDAAAATVREAVRAYNERLMAAESDRAAAYPVSVTLRYGSRPDADEPMAIETGGNGGSDGTSRTDGTGSRGGGDGAGDGGSGTNGDGGGTDDSNAVDGSQGDASGVPNVGTNALFGSQSGSPASISPPFPFASLLLAFAFLVPFNFLIQAYGSAILDERVNRRGELLLVSPATRGEIVAGKSLPYLLAAVIVTAGIAAVVGGGATTVLSVVPVAFVFLAATFLAAMFARSFKELTFLTVAISVFLTTYVFVPAIFTNVTPIAAISPLTLVVRDLQGTAVTVGEYLFATGPFYLTGTLCFVLGAGTYREEDMFSQKRVPAKFLDALSVRLSGLRSMVILVACTIPFVFLAELLAVAVLFALPVAVSVPILLVAVAFIEEIAKSVPVYAGFVSGTFERSTRSALAVGAASGLGFFLGEKLTAVVQVVGLSELVLGRAAFTPSGVLPAGSPGFVALVALGLFLAPLVLHVVATSIAALGARRGRSQYAIALAIATLVHAAYNLSVVSLHG